MLNTVAKTELISVDPVIKIDSQSPASHLDQQIHQEGFRCLNIGIWYNFKHPWVSDRQAQGL